MDTRTILRWLAVPAIGAALLLGACGGDDDDTDGGNGGGETPTSAVTEPANGETPDNGDNGDNGEAEDEWEISMIDNEFVPNTFVVPVGEPVTITATNDGIAVHNMVVKLPDGNVSSDALVRPGDSSTFEVTFPEAGTYDFQCDYHMPDMVGTITAQ